MNAVKLCASGEAMKCAIFRMRWILLLWLPGLTMTQPQMPDSLTVEQAVQLVLQNHPAIQQASQSVIAAGARVKQSRSAYYPEIEANAFYSRVGPVPSLEVPGLGSLALFPINNYNANLSVRHTFFDFGKRLAAVELAQSFEQTAGNNMEFLKTTLAFQTVEMFYAILYLHENLNVQNDLIDALNQHLVVTQKKAQTGTATDFDVLTTQVRVATAKSQKISIDRASNTRVLDGFKIETPNSELETQNPERGRPDHGALGHHHPFCGGFRVLFWHEDRGQYYQQF